MRPNFFFFLNQVCKIMTNTSIGPQIDRLAAVNSLLLTDKKKCFDYKYEKLISEMKNTSWDSEEAEGGNECNLMFYFKSLNLNTFLHISYSMDVSNVQ